MKSTKEDLKRLKKRYGQVMDLMIKHADKPKTHPLIQRLMKAEDRLGKKEIQMEKELGIHINNPCPLAHNQTACETCTGYYAKVSVPVVKYSKKKKKVTVVVEKDFTGSEVFYCEIKSVLATTKS